MLRLQITNSLLTFWYIVRSVLIFLLITSFSYFLDETYKLFAQWIVQLYNGGIVTEFLCYWESTLSFILRYWINYASIASRVMSIVLICSLLFTLFFICFNFLAYLVSVNSQFWTYSRKAWYETLLSSFIWFQIIVNL